MQALVFKKFQFPYQMFTDIYVNLFALGMLTDAFAWQTFDRLKLALNFFCLPDHFMRLFIVKQLKIYSDY